MGEVFNLNLDRMIKALSLREGFERELLDGVQPVLDITQFLDLVTAAGHPLPKQSGILSWIGVNTPAVGNDPTPVVTPNGKRWRVKAWLGTLATSAVAGNRRPALALRATGPIVFSLTPSIADQPASVTWSYYFGAGNPTGIQWGTNIDPPFSNDLWLRASWTISTITNGLLAGDQWTNLNLLVEEFDEASPAPIGIIGIAGP